MNRVTDQLQIKTSKESEVRAYRADIDGLRAIAVTAVLLFHFKVFPNLISGGFIGVDVFFVISGYLITNIIFRGVDDGTYNVLEFYNRRIRRIFPALFAMYFACLVISGIAFFPREVATTGRSVVASITFVSNILFYLKSGYFDRENESNPLLHTWSLSVEEQFYLIFPVIVFLLRGQKKSLRIGSLVVLAAGSFIYSAYMVMADTNAAFYLVQFRAWELLIGSLVAVGAFPSIRLPIIANVVSLVGLTVLGFSITLISKSSVFPGPLALAPCLATAAIIHANANYQTLIGKLLSLKPMRLIGLISYSLYLWHWPVYVFYKLHSEPDRRLDKAVLICVSFMLAVVSYRYVENYFRDPPHRFGRRATFLIGGCTMAFGVTAALLTSPLNALLWKYPEQAIQVAAYDQVDERPMRLGTCFHINTFRGDFEGLVNNCLKLSETKKNFLLIGDSHAAHLWSGLSATYPQINFLQATAAGCRPVAHAAGDKECISIRDFVFDQFVPSHHLDGIIISGRWLSEEIDGLVATVKRLSVFSDRIIVSGPIVEYDQPLPRILASAITSGEDPQIFATKHRVDARRRIDGEFKQTLQRNGIEYFSVYEALCAQGCTLWAGRDVPLQFDLSHLTTDGSALLARLFPITYPGAKAEVVP